MSHNHHPKIGHEAPHFKGKAYLKGQFFDIDSRTYKGKYVVLFFYPLDFTFVCPTEIISFAEAGPSFESNNTVLIGASIDSHFVHMKWCQTPLKDGGLGEIGIPLLSDITKEISISYGALIESGENQGVALRATFIIDDKGILRHMSYSDLPVGRNVDEVLRLVQAFQFTDEHGEVCPSKWKKKGDKTMKTDHSDKITKEYFDKVHSKKG